MSAVKVAQPKNSVRAQSKADPFATKAVFRPVLNNPLNLAWPTLSAPIRNQILEALLEFLNSGGEENSIAQWRLQEHARRRGRVHGSAKVKDIVAVEPKKKRSRKSKGKGKGEAVDVPIEEMNVIPSPGDKNDSTPIASTSAIPFSTHPLTLRSEAVYNIPDTIDKDIPTKRVPLPRPSLLNHVSVGINEVTRALETRIRWGRWELGDTRAMGSMKEVEKDIKNLPKDENKKKVTRRSKNHFRTKRLQIFDPVSAITLARPSYQFLSRPIPSPSEELPSYLLPPTETLPFFRMLADTRKKSLAPGEKINVAVNRAKLLGSIMRDDDPKAAAASKRPTRKRKAAFISVDVGSKTTVEPGQPKEMEDDWIPFLDIIFVCKPDINPPSLVEHLPTMAAAINGISSAIDLVKSEGIEQIKSNRPNGDVLIVTLDVGAEHRLAEALALRRVAAIGLSSEAPGIAPLLELVRKHVKPIQAPWLVPHLSHLAESTAIPTAQLIPTQIKHLRSTAPVDPRARIAADQEAKAAKRAGIYVAVD